MNDYTRDHPGDQPDDTVKRNHVLMKDKLDKYRKQLAKLTKKVQDSHAFQLMITKAVLRILDKNLADLSLLAIPGDDTDLSLLTLHCLHSQSTFIHSLPRLLTLLNQKS
jgi:hypothetical protein